MKVPRGLPRWLLLGLSMLLASAAWAAEPLRVGSKRFTESYILAELIAQTAAPHTAVEVKQGLGNTAIVQAALRSGAIDIYAEYSGTLSREILGSQQALSLAQMRERLAPLGLGVDVPLGFNNGYALAMTAARAQALGISRLSDLAAHPELRPGLSHEFIGRADGWPGLAQRYHLTQQPRGLDHGLAYEALAAGQVDLIDIYTTDAKIEQLGLRLLADDAGHFPRYDALLVYRLDLPARLPAAWAALQTLRGRIDEPAMIAMNARAELQGQGFAQIAGELLRGKTAQHARRSFTEQLLGDDLGRLARQHLLLVLAAVGLATLIGVPLAVAVAPHARSRALLLSATGLLQTVPSLALLAVLIALLGQVGTLPALIALALYSLLPIMRNTCVGLAEVPAGLRLAAQALGLTRGQSLWLVELPLARPVLLAGLRTATSLSVGTATLAAFVGAGGFGERIVTGLALNDTGLMLAGAVPAAALALGFEALFEMMERHGRRPVD
jgi:osmoprotectant transport system permease protein